MSAPEGTRGTAVSPNTGKAHIAVVDRDENLHICWTTLGWQRFVPLAHAERAGWVWKPDTKAATS